MTATSARICECGTGPNVARGQTCGHLERTKAKPGGRSECPHRGPDGQRCGSKSSVLSAKTLADLLALEPAEDAGDEDAIWPAEGPPAHWREMLGDEDPNPCDSDGCDCGGPPARYTCDHTGSVCPDPQCSPSDCWSPSAAAEARARAYREGAARKAARSGTASPAVPQRELDRQARELAKRKALVRAAVAKVLDEPHLTGQSRAAWAWFLPEIDRADAARLAELEDEIRAEPVDRAGFWRRSFGTIREYLESSAEGDEADDEDDYGEPDDDEDQGVKVIRIDKPRPAAAIEQAPRLSGSVLCELCVPAGKQSPAVARIRSNVPNMIPERDVCPEHFRFFAESIERMTFGDLIIIKSYGTAPGVHSIVRSGTRSALGAVR